MTRSTLAVFEKTSTGWGAFALDFPTTGGLGETVEETRQSLLEGIGYVLQDSSERERVLSEPIRTNLDFSEFDPEHVGHYVIEWLAVPVPTQSETEIAA